MCYKILSRNGVPSIRNNAFLSLFVVFFVNLGITFGGHHWRFVHPRPRRNYSLRRRLPRPPRGPASPRRVRNRTASQRPFLIKLGSHSTAATNQRSRGVPSVLPTARQSMNSYSESTRPRRRYSLHLIYFSGAHGHASSLH